jgi:hypothetical protein
MPENKDTKKPKDVEEVVVLVDGHEHEGKICEKGQKIEVPSYVKEWGQELKPQIFK